MSEPEAEDQPLPLVAHLTELRDKGSADPLSARLSAQSINIQNTLAEFLVALKAAQPQN